LTHATIADGEQTFALRMIIGIPTTLDDFPRMNLGVFIEHLT
jgi:hypothetical protein